MNLTILSIALLLVGLVIKSVPLVLISCLALWIFLRQGASSNRSYLSHSSSSDYGDYSSSSWGDSDSSSCSSSDSGGCDGGGE